MSVGLPLPSIDKQWSIGIYAGSHPTSLSSATDARNPVITAADVTDAPALFVADPFMLRAGNSWSMFFEVFRSDSHKGDIALATSTDGLTWSYQQIVLTEPFHLSYPYVFQWGPDYYMLPESQDEGHVRLYRATAFPCGWTYERTLLTGPFADTSIVRHQDRWWLFTTGPHNASLMVFHAETLDGPWQPHARNPVVAHSPERARSAGRLISLDGRLLRMTQDASGSYGRQVSAQVILTLTPDVYIEAPAMPTPVLSGSGEGWNARGMHHIDAHEISPGHWLACVDGYRKSLMFGYRRWPSA